MSWSTVFTDAFTVGADTAINVYPSAGSPDYAYNSGAGGDATVNAANDRVQCTAAATVVVVRMIDGAVPTSGRYRATFGSAGQFQATFSNATPAARCSSVADDAYILFWGSTTVLDLYRRVGGSDGSPIATLTFPVAQNTVANIFMEVEGGTSAQRIVFGCNGYSQVFYDTNAARLTTGGPGFYLYDDPTANRTFLDDLTVEQWVVENQEQSESLRHIPNV